MKGQGVKGPKIHKIMASIASYITEEGKLLGMEIAKLTKVESELKS